ncbi:hypothetical protein [Streptomyces sp. NPDC058308]|uniref:hypothetical protein n=1 Tax=Streptomyces sp. NPDC058308 TaxID=3346440 RepID=UPI0036ED7C1C
MSKIRRARHPAAQHPPAWGARVGLGSPSAPAPPPPSPPSPYTYPAPHRRDAAPSARASHRVFFWVFLAIQVLFLIWVVAGLASGSGASESCSGLSGDGLKVCEDAGDVGTTIGVGLIVGFWLATDFIVALTYAVYRISARKPRR